jgi:hypothetical protein
LGTDGILYGVANDGGVSGSRHVAKSALQKVDVLASALQVKRHSLGSRFVIV